MAELAAAMHVELGMPLDRWHVTCHSEVYERGWGSYPTACCGDDLRSALDAIVEEAKQIVADAAKPPAPKRKVPHMAQRAYYARVRQEGTNPDGTPILVDDGEWMMAGVDIPPHPDGATDPNKAKQDGYRVTLDKSEAVLWGRQYSTVGPNDGPLTIRLLRDDYVKQQAFARADAVEYRRAQTALIRAALAGS